MPSKRIRVKVGDIFRIRNTDPEKYLQLVLVDQESLGSDVVVVYEDNPDNYDFYVHTSVAEGVRNELWDKIGHEAVKVDLGSLKFKTFLEPTFWWERSKWRYWACDGKKSEKLGLRRGAKVEAVDGDVYPAGDVVYRIKYGKSEFVSDWPS